MTPRGSNGKDQPAPLTGRQACASSCRFFLLSRSALIAITLWAGSTFAQQPTVGGANLFVPSLQAGKETDAERALPITPFYREQAFGTAEPGTLVRSEPATDFALPPGIPLRDDRSYRWRCSAAARKAVVVVGRLYDRRRADRSLPPRRRILVCRRDRHLGRRRPGRVGFAIANYVWWIGIASSGTIISALFYLTQSEWRSAVNRIAESMTLFAAAAAGIMPILHLGRPSFFYWLFPIPNTMGLWPQFRSPLLWDFFAILTYVTSSILFWFLGLLPDLALVRDRATTRRSQLCYGILAMGWTGSHRQWRLHKTAYGLLAALMAIRSRWPWTWPDLECRRGPPRRSMAWRSTQMGRSMPPPPKRVAANCATVVLARTSRDAGPHHDRARRQPDAHRRR